MPFVTIPNPPCAPLPAAHAKKSLVSEGILARDTSEVPQVTELAKKNNISEGLLATFFDLELF